MFDRQATFNTAFLGLQAQGFVQAKVDMLCAYRGDAGTKCAIGHCIPDDEYNRLLEGRGARIEEISKIIGYSYGSEDSHWAYELQVCHDRGVSPLTMQESLFRFAMKHNLTVPMQTTATVL